MTEAVTATLALRVSAQLAATPPIGGMTQQVNQNASLSFTPGNGAANLSDRMLTVAIDIAASGTDTIDLSTVLDAFGAAFAPADIQALVLTADATNTNNIVIGDAASDGFVGPMGASGVFAVKPGGILAWGDPSGWPVTLTTADQLMLANSGAGSAVTGSLIIIGRSA